MEKAGIKLKETVQRVLSTVLPGVTASTWEQGRDAIMHEFTDIMSDLERDHKTEVRGKLKDKDTWWKLKLETQRLASKGALANEMTVMKAAHQREMVSKLNELNEAGDGKLNEALSKQAEMRGEISELSQKVKDLTSKLKDTREQSALETERGDRLEKEMKAAEAEAERLRNEVDGAQPQIMDALVALNIQVVKGQSLSAQIRACGRCTLTRSQPSSRPQSLPGPASQCVHTLIAVAARRVRTCVHQPGCSPRSPTAGC